MEPGWGWGEVGGHMEGVQAAGGVDLDMLSSICAAVVPSLPSFHLWTRFPLSVYGEIELGTQPKLHPSKCPGCLTLLTLLLVPLHPTEDSDAPGRGND